jgi:hypothetical protein
VFERVDYSPFRIRSHNQPITNAVIGGEVVVVVMLTVALVVVVIVVVDNVGADVTGQKGGNVIGRTKATRQKKIHQSH